MKNKPSNIFDKIINAIIYCNCLLEILLGAVLSILLSIDVFCRYILNNSLIFSEELSRVLFVWFAMLGTVIALHEGSHVGFDIVKNRFKGNTARMVAILTNLLIILYSGYVMSGCISILPKQSIQTYATLPVSHAEAYFSVVLAMALLIIRSLYSIYCLIAKREENVKSVQEMFTGKREVQV